VITEHGKQSKVVPGLKVVYLADVIEIEEQDSTTNGMIPGVVQCQDTLLPVQKVKVVLVAAHSDGGFVHVHKTVDSTTQRTGMIQLCVW